MIEFSTEPPSTELDLELANVESLSQLSKLFASILEHKKDGDWVSVALKPPIKPSLSIPLAFKSLMCFAQQMKEKKLSTIFYIQSQEVVDYLCRYMPKDHVSRSLHNVGPVMITLMTGDIVEVSAEAIVNASNRNLKLGGGVSGAIRKAASPSAQSILNHIASNRQFEHGDAVLTDGLGIAGIRHIIHVATVIGTEQVVRVSLKKLLQICEDVSIRKVAIPALGTGTGGLAMKHCAKVFREELTHHFTERGDTKLKEVVIVLWRRSDFEVFQEEFGPQSKPSEGS